MAYGFKKLEKVKEPENLEKAYEYALFLLSLKLRTEGEVREKMSRRGYSDEVVEKTIRQLKDQKYLDDQRYAEVFLDNLKKYKHFGYYGIKKKFMEKKLPAALIDSILKEGLTVQEEIKIAKKFLQKEGVEVKSASNDGENEYRTFDEEASKAKQKTAQKLKARGFRGEVIAKLVY